MITYTIIYIFSSIQPLVSAKLSKNLPKTFQSLSRTQKTGDRADRADHQIALPPDRVDHPDRADHLIIIRYAREPLRFLIASTAREL